MHYTMLNTIITLIKQTKLDVIDRLNDLKGEKWFTNSVNISIYRGYMCQIHYFAIDRPTVAYIYG